MIVSAAFLAIGREASWTYEICCLDKTEEESSGKEAAKGVACSCRSRDHAPENHLRVC